MAQHCLGDPRTQPGAGAASEASLGMPTCAPWPLASGHFWDSEASPVGRRHSDSSVRFLHSLRDTTANEPGVGPAERGSGEQGSADEGRSCSQVGSGRYLLRRRWREVVRDGAAGHQEVRELVVMYTVNPMTGQFILILLWPQKVFCFWCIYRFLTSGIIWGPQWRDSALPSPVSGPGVL